MPAGVVSDGASNKRRQSSGVSPTVLPSRGAAGAALSYAVLTMFGNLTFDNVWQALYFLGCGFILSEVVSVLREQATAASPKALVLVPSNGLPKPATRLLG